MVIQRKCVSNCREKKKKSKNYVGIVISSPCGQLFYAITFSLTFIVSYQKYIGE